MLPMQDKKVENILCITWVLCVKSQNNYLSEMNPNPWMYFILEEESVAFISSYFGVTVSCAQDFLDSAFKDDS